MNTLLELNHGAGAPSRRADARRGRLPPRCWPETRRERRVPISSSARLMVTGLVVALVAALLLAGCGAPATTAAAAPPLVLRPQDTDGIVNVTLGRLVEIRLPSNPATGYRWDLDRLDAGVLRLEGPPEFQPDPANPGGVGTTVFRFRAARVGNGMLRLAHRLPWEQANKGETFTAMVRVREG